jgi:carotenoid 1,2-hydratase
MTAAASVRPPSADPAELDRLMIGLDASGAYQWWYFDALSDDGRFGMVAIYFVGGVFSPLYADRLAAGIPAAPADHPMINLALYDRAKQVAWVFSELPREALTIHDPLLDVQIGGSRLTRTERGYELVVDDLDVPRGRRLEAKIRFEPQEPGLLPPGGRLSHARPHWWGSPAPHCRVTLDCPSLGLKWSGHGYHDVNAGAEPLHVGFREWGWGRARVGAETRIYYDAREADGVRVRHVLTGRDGRLEHRELPPTAADARRWTPWLLRLPSEPEAGELAGERLRIRPVTRWESSPFYERWVASFAAGQAQALGICEHVDLGRFASPFVRFMLRYRIYRREWPGSRVHRSQVHRRELFPNDATSERT